MGNWTPSIVPNGDSETVYLVLDDFGDLGRCWREADVATAADLETVISDLLKGEYANPVRVISFNTAEGWSRDVSEGVASELQYRCVRQGNDVPAGLEGFIERHVRRDRAQLRLVARVSGRQRSHPQCCRGAQVTDETAACLKGKSAQRCLLRYKVDRSQEKDA
jgi:hypothetical protein